MKDTSRVGAAGLVWLMAAAGAMGQSDRACGRYEHFFPPVVLRQKTAIEAADAQLYRTLVSRPVYYQFELPAGEYAATVYYLSGGGDAGSFSVEVNGHAVVGRTAYWVKGKDVPASLEVKQQQFKLTSTVGSTRVRFPRTPEQDYAIAAIAVVGDKASFRIDCGAKADFTDARGRLWLADDALPFPDVTVELDRSQAAKGEWVNVSDEIIRKLEAAGVEAIVKWNGIYTRRLNGVVVARDGSTFVNLSGIGLWSYGGPGGTLKRVDGGRYTACQKGYSVNPYGPGFFLFSSHGFGDDKYQIFTLDNKAFENSSGNRDFGSVDWSEYPPKQIICNGHDQTLLFVSTDGGKTFRKVADDQRKLSVVGALPGGVLIRCLSSRTPGPETGIYRSTDAGARWDQVSTLDVGQGQYSLTSWNNSVYIHTPAGLAVSRDTGQSWTLLKHTPVFTCPVLLGESDQHLLGFNRDGGYESADCGVTWKKVLPPPPATKMYIQSHPYYDFAWDITRNVVYAYAPDSVWRLER